MCPNKSYPDFKCAVQNDFWTSMSEDNSLKNQEREIVLTRYKSVSSCGIYIKIENVSQWMSSTSRNLYPKVEFKSQNLKLQRPKTHRTIIKKRIQNSAIYFEMEESEITTLVTSKTGPSQTSHVSLVYSRNLSIFYFVFYDINHTPCCQNWILCNHAHADLP